MINKKKKRKEMKYEKKSSACFISNVKYITHINRLLNNETTAMLVKTSLNAPIPTNIFKKNVYLMDAEI